jgi:hypothetical protein
MHVDIVTWHVLPSNQFRFDVVFLREIRYQYVHPTWCDVFSITSLDISGGPYSEFANQENLFHVTIRTIRNQQQTENPTDAFTQNTKLDALGVPVIFDPVLSTRCGRKNQTDKRITHEPQKRIWHASKELSGPNNFYFYFCNYANCTF